MDRKNKTWFWESNRGNKNFFASIENLVMVLTPSKVDNFKKNFKNIMSIVLPVLLRNIYLIICNI